MRCDSGFAWIIAFCCISTVVEGACVLPLLSNYQFNGDLTDSEGNGPPLERLPSPSSGALGAGDFSFAEDEGLRLTTDVTSGDYCIELDLNLAAANFTGFDKLIDFTSLSSFQGLTISTSSSGRLIFNGSPVGVGTLDVPAAVTIGILRTGNNVDITINGAVDGSSFVHSGNSLTTAVNKQLHFFLDEAPAGNEAGASGSVSAIRIFAVPEPSAFFLMGFLAISTWFQYWKSNLTP